MNIMINNQTGIAILPAVEKAIREKAEEAIRNIGDPHESYTVNAHRLQDGDHINLTLVHHICVLDVKELTAAGEDA